MGRAMTDRTASKRSSGAAKAHGAKPAAKAAPAARFRMRVTSGETISVGPGKVALLEAIQKTRSITAAAKSIGMSYRRAWMLIDELNAALKKPAVHSLKGGEHGGGSEVTPAGEALVDVYRRIELRAAKACASDIRTLLKLVK
jgi:molybdate transport system regulatory protein